MCASERCHGEQMLRKKLLNKNIANNLEKNNDKATIGSGQNADPALQNLARKKAEDLSRMMEDSDKDQKIKQGIQVAGDNTKTSDFQRTFKKGSDFVYGMRKPRAEYITNALGSEASVMGGTPTVDGQNRYIVPINYVDATIDLSIVSISIKQYHDFLAQHPNVKYQALSEYRDRIAHSQPNILPEREKYIILSCKAKIEETALKGNMIHFVLDSGNHDWDMEAVVNKEGKAGNIITAKELRHIYKNWSTLSQNVTFWREGQKVQAPWEENKELWDKFIPKKDKGSESSQQAFENFKTLYDVFKKAKSEYESNSDPSKRDSMITHYEELKKFCIDMKSEIEKSPAIKERITKLMTHADQIMLPHLQNTDSPAPRMPSMK